MALPFFFTRLLINYCNLYANHDVDFNDYRKEGGACLESFDSHLIFGEYTYKLLAEAGARIADYQCK
jgi:hypothetical protein